MDKELNNYIMRCREWYGWHFPEMGKIVTDNLAFAKTVRHMGELAVFIIIVIMPTSFGPPKSIYAQFHWPDWAAKYALSTGA